MWGPRTLYAFGIHEVRKEGSSASNQNHGFHAEGERERGIGVKKVKLRSTKEGVMEGG